MDNSNCFVIESGIDIYGRPKKERNGKWKELAVQMKAPQVHNGTTILDSVHHTPEGECLTQKQSIALMKALAKQGFKGTSRRNGNGYRVWRIS